MTRIRTVGWGKYTGRLAGTAACARVSRPAPPRSRSGKSSARPRALTRQQSRQGQRMRRLRQRTIEPVFSSLLQHYGLRRVNTRGRSGAHKTMLLTAIAFNLKKLLKHQPKRTLRLAMALPRMPLEGQFLPYWREPYRRQCPQ
ncbi:transposase [Hymenobacter bucti]|uniref:Transposase n=1 Tax=Hymenobacter bucti TaxID=1844114 RepID=A0ABW4QZQ9_9BACT